MVRNVSGMIKTSAVLIAEGGERSFYRSVQEVPEPMRTRLIESTNSANSGTIVIADRAGKQQISRAMQRKMVSGANSSTSPVVAPGSRRLTWLAWMALAFVLTTGAVLSVLFHVRW